MTDLFALAASDSLAFAATSSGIMRSCDGGQTWEAAFDSLGMDEDIAATAVTLAPQFEVRKTLLAATPGAILRSTDGGETWQVAYLPTPPPFITALAVSPAFQDDRAAFATSLEDGVFCSLDGGASWNSWNFGLLDFQVLSLVVSPYFQSDQTLFIGTGSGLFTSINAGRAWREIVLPCGHTPVLSLAITPELLLVGTETAGLYATRDRGQTWQRLGEEVLETINAVLTEGTSILVLAPGRMLVSHDHGNSWESIPLPAGKAPVAACANNGLGAGCQVLVGFEDGEIVLVSCS